MAKQATIQPYYTSTSGLQPLPENLIIAEIAVNAFDGRLYILDSGGNIVKIGDKTWGNGYPRDYIFILGRGTQVSIGVSLPNALIVPRAGIIIKAFVYAGSPPTGADLVIDINKMVPVFGLIKPIV